MNTEHDGTLRFASWELDRRSRELRDGARCVRLQEQPFAILCQLLERPGEVVTRDELRQRLWPDGTFVDFEHSLNAAVKRLRAALGDDADAPRFIETVPRRGYRLIAGAGPVPGAAADLDRAGQLPRLAVLPFSNLTDDSRQEYFSDGLTEEFIAQLGTLSRGKVAVIARWSSMAFKGSLQRAREVGEALRADYLLEGSVRREGSRVRVAARLIQTGDETQTWSDTYEREAGDDLATQADVATRLARSLAMELVPMSPMPSTVAPDSDAYQSYLKGRYYWNKPGDVGLDQALAYFGEGLKVAPTFAAAHAAVARAMIARAEYYRDVPRVALLRARESALRALELDPQHGEAHLALADVRRMLDLDWQGADASYQHALSVIPTYDGVHRSYALLLSALGQHADAVRESTRARELDPFCLIVATSDAWTRYAAGDYEGAISRCRHTIDLDPEYLMPRRVLGAAYLQSGQREAAVDALEEALAVDDSDPVVLCWLAHAKATAGSRREAVELVDRAKAMVTLRYVPPYHLALAAVGLGELDEAFALLDEALIDRDPLLSTIPVDSRLAVLRADPRYQELLGRMNMPGSPVAA